MSPEVAIVDYGMGNIRSLAVALRECGREPLVTADPQALAGASAIILPGVGSFAMGIERLHETGLVDCLTELVLGDGKPLLGICLGMHLLAEWGTEGGDQRGLGWIPGRVAALRGGDPTVRIPHMGWNEVEFTRPSALFKGVASAADFYFVHSYHLVPADPSTELARTPYAGGFVSAVGRANIFGVQFHPEKSQRLGLRVLQNFLGG